jgi:hypothetical protein
MNTRYSKTTGTFYPLDIDYPNLPVDIQEVALVDYKKAMARPVGATFSFDATGILTITPAPAPTIDELKAAKNDEINRARLAANQTTFEHGGKLVACDPLSRSDIDAVAIHVARSGAFPTGFPGAWKAVDNSYIMLPDLAAWDAFYASMTAQGTANFNHAQALKEQLKNALTKEEIDAIRW